MKDITYAPARMAYVCPMCGKRIDIDAEPFTIRANSKNLNEHQISSGKPYVDTCSNYPIKATISPAIEIYCEDCSTWYKYIDVEIASLVQALIEHGVTTVASCSGHGGTCAYDGMDEIKEMMRRYGYDSIYYVSAYVVYHASDHSISLVDKLLNSAIGVLSGEEISPSTVYIPIKSNKFRQDIPMVIRNHTTKRYGGQATIPDEDGPGMKTVHYHELSITFSCDNLCQMDQADVQKIVNDTLGTLAKLLT